MISFLSPTGDNRWLCKPFFVQKRPFLVFFALKTLQGLRKSIFSAFVGLQKEVKPSVLVLAIFLGRAQEYIITIQEWAGGLVIRVAFGVF